MSELKDTARVFAVGGNLADGTRFEKGQKVPSDLDKKELEALTQLGAIESKKKEAK